MRVSAIPRPSIREISQSVQKGMSHFIIATVSGFQRAYLMDGRDALCNGKYFGYFLQCSSLSSRCNRKEVVDKS